MALRFKFRKERLVTDANFYLFHEFVTLWKWDRTRDKRKANKLFLFIYYLCDLSEDNVLRDYPADQKEKESLFRVYGDSKHKFTAKERELLAPAIDCYIMCNTAAEERILESFDTKAEELRTVLSDVKPETVENSKDGVTAFASNTSIITGGLKELDMLKKLKVNVIAAVRKEAMMQSVRGQVTLSPLSRGDIDLAAGYEVYAQYGTNTIQGEGKSKQELYKESGLEENTEEGDGHSDESFDLHLPVQGRDSE